MRINSRLNIKWELLDKSAEQAESILVRNARVTGEVQGWENPRKTLSLGAGTLLNWENLP